MNEIEIFSDSPRLASAHAAGFGREFHEFARIFLILLDFVVGLVCGETTNYARIRNFSLPIREN